MKVSIVVPIYNVEKYLDKCLNSLVNQTIDDIEIICVNDGSTDLSQTIVDKYVKMYPNKVVGYIKENGGLSDARNYGIARAKGNYIGFVDSDDYVNVTMFEKMYDEACTSNADIVVCGYYSVKEGTEKTRKMQTDNMEMYGYSLVEQPYLLCISVPYAWNKIYKRELFERTGITFPKGLIFEDIPTIYALFLYANKICKVNEPLYYYITERDGGITKSYNDKMLQMFDSLKLLNQRYKENGSFEKFRDQLCFINKRHTIIRFEFFVKYKNIALKRKLLDKGFEHLNDQFPEWKSNKYYREVYYKNHKILTFFEGQKWFWKLLIVCPNFITRGFMKVGKIWRLGIKGLKKLSFINKFYYVNCCRKKNIRNNQVLFESFHGKTINDSPLAMMEEIYKKNNNYIIYCSSSKNDKSKHRKILKSKGLKNIKLVVVGSRKYAKVLATSKFLINNVSFPPYFIRRPEQIYLNTWHGTPLKTLGKKMINGIEDMSNIQRNFLQTTHMLFPNKFTFQHMFEDYNLINLFTGKVILGGYPRNTIFFDSKTSQMIRDRYHMEDKKTYAYMPTWRGATSANTNVDEYENTLKKILGELDNTMSNNQLMYVNLHSLVSDKIELSEYKHIKGFPDDCDTYTFLNSVDVLITDYSSVFFDFSITGKEIVLFMYDYKEYMAERSMYFDVNELPFTKIYCIEDMVSYIQTNKIISSKLINDKRSRYSDLFLCKERINNTELINDYIFNSQNNELEILDYSTNKDIIHDVYFSPKITSNESIEKLKKVYQLTNPLAVFIRDEFSEKTREVLQNEYNQWLDYVVIDKSRFEGVREYISVSIHSRRNEFVCDGVYKNEIKRVLPNIKINRILVDGDEYHKKAIEHAFLN